MLARKIKIGIAIAFSILIFGFVVRDWYHIFDTTKHNFWLRIRHIFDGQPKQFLWGGTMMKYENENKKEFS